MPSEGTTERVLRLLALLQRRAMWTAVELSAELGVTDRSVRRDIERLRSLGYPVDAVPGVGGGYRLGAGKELPPLLLDDEEATATAVSLRMAAGGTISGIGDAALRALAKLDQVMPPRLRGGVRAVYEATETLDGTQEIDVEILTVLSRACRDRVRVRFLYTRYGAQEQERRVEPVRMVAAGWHWYLMAYDVDREDWRTFRLDRMRSVVATTWRFRAREHPDPVEYVQESVTASPYSHLARVRLHAPAEEVRRRVPPRMARIEEDTEGWCILTAGADDLDWLALHIAMLDLETEILEPPELRDAAAALAHRLMMMS
ncbi:helix-turn-helix transcriptional regulator [Nesterenkonia ebinurensis]|uniref:helix-turn-helix transcriptional regulator n=1 Tax=Nesterenkonia ebinurensis TaxID=2608252 RepID=UPI00123E3E24|nr:YafY family protein [Nesterenkonia ebinurensis]